MYRIGHKEKRKEKKMSKFSIPQNGPYFTATLDTLTSRQIGQLMVQAQHDLDRVKSFAQRQILRELIRECAGEYLAREYPESETH